MATTSYPSYVRPAAAAVAAPHAGDVAAVAFTCSLVGHSKGVPGADRSNTDKLHP